MGESAKPLFTIITVTLNHLSGLKQTWQSLKEQECRDFEWIVVDGGSTDGTVEFLRTVDFPLFFWISEKDNGLYDAMNKGIEMSQGVYLLFLNAGDMLASAAVLQQLKTLIHHKKYPDFLFGDAYQQMSDGTLQYKKALPLKLLWYGMFTYHQAMVFKRDKVFCRYDVSLEYAADYQFVCEFIRCVDNHYYANIPICVFEAGGKSQTGSTKQADDEQMWVRQQILKYPWYMAIAIRGLHMGAHFLRKYFSIAYNVIRYRIL